MPRISRRADPAYLVGQLVSPEAARHGDYNIETIVSPAGDKVRVVRNRGASTLDRWRSTGALTDAQNSAIDLYVRSWRLRFEEPRVTGQYSATASIRTTGAGIEHRSNARLRAKDTLDIIDQEVFAKLLPHYRSLFVGIVLDDLPADIAAQHLESVPKAARVAARTIVALVADMIDLAFNRKMTA